MKIWFRSKSYRTPVELMGYTGYATDEGALIPWPVMRRIMQGIQETKDHFELLAAEMQKWHNQIPDGEERLESIRRTHENATGPFDRITLAHNAADNAEACLNGGSMPTRSNRPR